MLHSLGLNRMAFDRLSAKIGVGWSVNSFDMYAHGAASALTAFNLNDCVDAAVAAVEHIGDEKVHLVGHSMGGTIAALCCARIPARIASLALIATPPVGGPAFSGRGEEARRLGIGAMIGPTINRWFGVGPSALQSSDAISYARECLQSMEAEGFASSWEALASFKGYWNLAKFMPMHTVCIAGADDASTPPILMAQIQQACQPKPISIEVVADSGHMLPLTKPESLAALLEELWSTARDT
jgi:pimeloyl-ACP methyl ester carboxylesterase